MKNQKPMVRAETVESPVVVMLNADILFNRSICYLKSEIFQKKSNQCTKRVINELVQRLEESINFNQSDGDTSLFSIYLGARLTPIIGLQALKREAKATAYQK